MAKRLFHFIIYSNLFIAACAVAMATQTYWLVLHSQPDWNFLYFVFFSTICSYSFHWYLTSHSIIPSARITWANKYRSVHLVFFFIGSAGSIIFFFFLRSHWYWLLLSAIITFLYSAPKIPHPLFRALRKVALGKTIFLAMVWMYVTTILPVLITQQTWRADFTLFALHRFFLIYAICILFDYRDRQDDREAGIRSLITYLSPRGILYLFITSISIFLMATLWMNLYGYSTITIAVLVLPGIITAGLYNYAQRNFSDTFYYFILDGLMALSAVMTQFGVLFSHR